MRSTKNISARNVRCSAHLPPAITVTPSPYLQGANWLGRVVALVCLVPALPLMAVLMLLVRLTSRGPALLKQARVGQHGRVFLMYKIRSMVRDAELETGPTWAQQSDPRITLFGRCLRRTHLDELPQLLNVVRGEMALFGPRPERPELVPGLAAQIPHYYDRLAVLPGITGLAQINLPPDRSVECVQRKLQLDLEYIRTAHPAIHVRMFVWTLLRLAGVPATLATSWMGLRRNVQTGLPAARSEPAAAVPSDPRAVGPTAAIASRLRRRPQEFPTPVASMPAQQLGEQ